MAKLIMVQGTCSNAGKSLLCAALCRIFRQDGYRVAPFKSQNMALNSFITADGKEMGRAQVVQAEAAGIAPDVRMNPILLKPTSDVGSQVIIMGEARGNRTAREYWGHKKALLPVIKEAFDSLAAENDIMHWSQEVDPDRISIGIAPAPIYMCHPAVFGRVSELATRDDLPVAMHLAGSREEYYFVKRGSSSFSVHGESVRRGFLEIPPWLPTGVSPVRYALNWGAFESPNVLAVHCVHTDEEDVKKLKEYNVAIAVCPRCNAQLGMGVAPVDEFMRAGLRVGIGTDSPAATDSTDMLSEMRLGMLIQRAVNVGRFLDSESMLEMATIGGARALKLDDEIGSLEIGKRADVIAVDLSSSQQSPSTNPVSAMVNTCTSADVIMTMVDGKTLYERDKWHIDVEVAKHIARVIEIRGKLRL